MRRHSPGHAFAFVDERAQVFLRPALSRPCASTMAIVVVSIGLFEGRTPPRNLEWTDQARGPALPRSPSRNGSAGFFPLPPNSGIPLEKQKSRLPPSSAVLRA